MRSIGTQIHIVNYPNQIWACNSLSNTSATKNILWWAHSCSVYTHANANHILWWPSLHLCVSTYWSLVNKQTHTNKQREKESFHFFFLLLLDGYCIYTAIDTCRKFSGFEAREPSSFYNVDTNYSNRSWSTLRPIKWKYGRAYTNSKSYKLICRKFNFEKEIGRLVVSLSLALFTFFAKHFFFFTFAFMWSTVNVKCENSKNVFFLEYCQCFKYRFNVER